VQSTKARRRVAGVCAPGLAVVLALTLSACEVTRGSGDRAADGTGAGGADRGGDRPGRRAERPRRGADDGRRSVAVPRTRRVDAPFPRAVRMLRRAPERGVGYDRELFVHWTDADGDGCDTRDEVLLAEAVRRPRVGDDCALSGGRWRSVYDGATTRDPSTFDVDHVVPLADAWASGARRWSDARREAFANDLGDARSLVAVTASSNRSKSDQDPGEWLPDERRCRYVRDWTAVKLRWDLAADPAEVADLTRRARRCGGRVVVRVVG
jgi:hypothetical protein